MHELHSWPGIGGGVSVCLFAAAAVSLGRTCASTNAGFDGDSSSSSRGPNSNGLDSTRVEQVDLAGLDWTALDWMPVQLISFGRHASKSAALELNLLQPLRSLANSLLASRGIVAVVVVLPRSSIRLLLYGCSSLCCSCRRRHLAVIYLACECCNCRSNCCHM